MPDPHDTAGAGWGPDPPDRPALPTVADPGPPATGDPAVDEAVSRLLDLGAVPLDGQPAVYEAVHRALQDRLADVEG